MTIQETKRTKKLNKQIEINIKRRTVIVDDKLVHHKGVPIPSWIELTLNIKKKQKKLKLVLFL